MHRITVAAAGDGWVVESDALAANGMLFLSGRKAELAARGLGARLARAGKAVEVRVFLRNGALAGGFNISPGGD